MSAQPTGGEVSHDLFGLTHCGKKKPWNEDEFLVAKLSRSARALFTSREALGGFPSFAQPDAHLFVIADGVGGAPGGSLASQTTIEVLAEQIDAAASHYHGGGVEAEHELIAGFERAIQRAHEAVIARRGQASRAATTLTMIALVWPRAYIFQVGDSRGYYLHGGRLRRITQDQTAAEAMIDAGQMTEERARASHLDKVLVRAIGSEDARPAVGIVDFDPGDVLLLCSDGLTRHVDDATISEVLGRGPSAEASCRELLQMALDGGGKDNITIIVGRLAIG